MDMFDKISIRFVFSKLYLYYGILGIISFFFCDTKDTLVTYIFFVLFSMLCCITLSLGILLLEYYKVLLELKKLNIYFFFEFFKLVIFSVLFFSVCIKLIFFIGFLRNFNPVICYISCFSLSFTYQLYKMKKDLNFLKTLL